MRIKRSPRDMALAGLVLAADTRPAACSSDGSGTGGGSPGAWAARATGHGTVLPLTSPAVEPLDTSLQKAP